MTWEDIAPNSFYALMAGKPLAGKTPRNGFVFVLWRLQGDRDFFSEDYGLPRFNVAKPCPCCPAEQSDSRVMPWNDFRRTATWIQNIYSNRDWRLLFPIAHCICSSQPGVGIETLAMDYMHDKHLGFDTYFLSAVLITLVYYMLPKTPSENLADVWKALDDWYHSDEGKRFSHNSFRHLTLKMFCNPSDLFENPPHLKGRAAEISSLTPALYHCFRAYMQNDHPDIEHHKKIRLCLRKSARLEEILLENREFDALPDVEALDFENTTFDMLAVYTMLNDEALKMIIPRRMFNITMKCHGLAHIAVNAKYINPRHGWCYGGEDLMNKMKSLAASCTKSRSIFKVWAKMNSKYLFAMHYEFTRERSRLR